MKRAVVIGGGIGGLAAAFSLREHQAKSADFEVVVLEKKGRVGGNIRTEKVDGFIIEGGPDCFLSEKPWAMELCKRLGLADELLPTNEENRKTFVLSGGRLHELPEGVILMIPTRMAPLLTSTLISLPGKLRMALEPFVPKRTGGGDESLGDFVRRRLGQEALDKIAEPLIAGIHAGDPETMSIRSSFPKFVQLEEEHGSLIRGMVKRMALLKGSGKPAAPSSPGKKITMFMTLRGGLSDLIDALASRLLSFGRTSIRTDKAVTSVTKKGGGYLVNIEGEPPLEADSVIIAAPAYAASQLIRPVDGGLADMLLTIPYVSTATVSLGFKRRDVAHPLKGFGFVVPRAEKRKIMAATWTSMKFNHRAPEDSVLIRCFVGGARDSELVSLGDTEMAGTVREELRDIMGIDAAPSLFRVYRWINSMPQYTIGHQERVERIEEMVAGHRGLYLTGSAYHGIGISDSIRIGEIVAKKALHLLSA